MTTETIKQMICKHPFWENYILQDELYNPTSIEKYKRCVRCLKKKLINVTLIETELSKKYIQQDMQKIKDEAKAGMLKELEELKMNNITNCIEQYKDKMVKGATLVEIDNQLCILLPDELKFRDKNSYKIYHTF